MGRKPSQGAVAWGPRLDRLAIRDCISDRRIRMVESAFPASEVRVALNALILTYLKGIVERE